MCRYFVSMLDGITEQHLATFLHILHNALWPYENDSKHDGSKEAKENYSNTYNKLKQYIKGKHFYVFHSCKILLHTFKKQIFFCLNL